MGYDVGCAGAFGLLVSDHHALEEILDTLAQKIDAYGETIDEDEDFVLDEQGNRIEDSEDYEMYRDRVADRAVSDMRTALYVDGIVVPNGVGMYYSGTEDERPGRTDTQAEQWVLGFGLFTAPWDYPPMHESFRRAADWHTWVWGG